MNQAWDLEETHRLMAHPAVRLLRSPNGPLTLTFLHRAFKEQQAAALPESFLRARLENFLDEARALHPGAYSQTAAAYLAEWCGEEQLLLKKMFSDEADEPVFELTVAAERAMQWLEDLQQRPFVAAESRLELIVRQLEEIVLYSSGDAERRIAALRHQQQQLQEQIDAIEATHTAAAYTPVQLTERLANALDLARGLASDFRQLEANFKEVARALADEQSRPGATKGKIVGRMLDTHAVLKESPQGQSFYAFWNHLSSPARQEQWRELVRDVYSLGAIDPQLRANRLLESLPGRLLYEGERVVRSNERMAATLRRALEQAATGEQRRLGELIREIQQQALASLPGSKPRDTTWELAGPPDVFNSFNRTLWQPETPGHFDGSLPGEDHILDDETLQRLRKLANLNLTRLRNQIRACLLTSDSVLLSAILERFPPQDGILEIVGYLIVATQEPQHYVPGNQFTDVQFQDGVQCERWRIPEVLYSRAT